MTNTIKIIKLEVSEWKKYKSLKLESLKNDSLAFGFEYEEAVDKKDDKWQVPLQNPNNYLLFAKDEFECEYNSEECCWVV